MAIDEARLDDVGSGLAPVTPGWFVVNAVDAAWVRNGAFGGRCVFESSPRVLAERPGVEPQVFTQTGFTLAVLEPGKPSGLYHAESTQEDFLVLAGTCLLLIEERERPLRAWDFVHCPPGTGHTFVGTGDEPCVIFMTGARRDGDTIVYPRSETALERGAGVEEETPSPAEAYAAFPHCRHGRSALARRQPGARVDRERASPVPRARRRRSPRRALATGGHDRDAPGRARGPDMARARP